MKEGGRHLRSRKVSQETVVEGGTNGSSGRKDDSEKPAWSLLPLDIVEDVVRVLTFGAQKYAPMNWVKVPNAKDRYLSAMLRHITAYQRGEVADVESGLSHLSHCICCAVFLAHFQKHGGGE